MIRQIASAYEDGATVAQIAARYSIAKNTVRKGLCAAGVETQPMRRRREIADQAEGIVDDYRDGRSIKQLAGKRAISERSVVKYLRAAGVPIRQRGRYSQLTDDQARHAVRLRKQGLSHQAIARRFGVTRFVVARALARRASRA
jgi:transposase-like protein